MAADDVKCKWIFFLFLKETTGPTEHFISHFISHQVSISDRFHIGASWNSGYEISKITEKNAVLKG